MSEILKLLNTLSLALQAQSALLVDIKHIIRITLERLQKLTGVATPNHFHGVLFPTNCFYATIFCKIYFEFTRFLWIFFWSKSCCFLAIFNKITIKLNLQREDWVLGCNLWCSFPFTLNPEFPKVLSLKSSSRQLLEAMVVQFLIAYSVNVLLVVTAFC